MWYRFTYADASRTARGPNRAPGREVTPVSYGTPYTTQSSGLFSGSTSSSRGYRQYVQSPEKRGFWRGSGSTVRREGPEPSEFPVCEWVDMT